MYVHDLPFESPGQASSRSASSRSSRDTDARGACRAADALMNGETSTDSVTQPAPQEECQGAGGHAGITSCGLSFFPLVGCCDHPDRGQPKGLEVLLWRADLFLGRAAVFGLAHLRLRSGASWASGGGRVFSALPALSERYDRARVEGRPGAPHLPGSPGLVIGARCSVRAPVTATSAPSKLAVPRRSCGPDAPAGGVSV